MGLPLPQLLKIMVDEGGTDLHITTNSAPVIRVNGKIRRIDHPPLNPAETKQIIYSILNDGQKHKLEEEWELDFSFGIKGIARFRANVFMQRGRLQEHLEEFLMKSGVLRNWGFRLLFQHLQINQEDWF